MDNILKTLFFALLAENKDDNPFDTDATAKAFYGTYDKWIEMAEIEDNLDAQNEVFGVLGDLECVERLQAFKTGLQVAFQLIMDLHK